MGRRAKHKQSAPEPLDYATNKTSNLLGKRKADSDHGIDESKTELLRPSKKVKDKKQKAASTTSSKRSFTKKSKSSPIPEPDSDSEDGWEDVDNKVDRGKYVESTMSLFTL